MVELLSESSFWPNTRLALSRTTGGSIGDWLHWMQTSKYRVFQADSPPICRWSTMVQFLPKLKVSRH
uniref:Uncharacterized protein n=1 Tax=Arundo donax TaxID=35708 RepID=A0A0A8ZIN0_ARUDO